jgi:hypothetical protein
MSEYTQILNPLRIEELIGLKINNNYIILTHGHIFNHMFSLYKKNVNQYYYDYNITLLVKLAQLLKEKSY